MPGAERRGVFLSYRRDDAGPYARSLQLQLSQRMPDARIFMDLDSIEPGLDFAEVIEEAVNSSAVLVALIGRQWMTLTGEDGARRLDNPDDYVRFEVTTALERGVRVIPVLIDGASALRRQDLPEQLHKLARLNAAKLSWDRYQDDADRLLDLIQRELAKVGEQPPAGEERERLDRKGGEEADRDNPEEIARQYPGAQEAAAPGGTAASTPWVHVPRTELTVTPDGGTVATAATAAQTPRPPQASPSQPSRGRTASTGALSPLTPEQRVVAQRGPESVRGDPGRAARLIADAVRAAQSITDNRSKPFALANVARALAATDPGGAVELLADAERTARSITDNEKKASALASVAEALAAIDPGGGARLIAVAEHIARSIPGGLMKVRALADVARALAATDPAHAVEMLADAERIARSITFDSSKASALARVAEALAAIDPGGAERIARSITDNEAKASALASVAEALAATDPGGAERIARSITDNEKKASALASVAEALTATCP